MKNDDSKVSPRQEKPQAQDSAVSGGWSGNNNGHRTNERSRVRNEGKVEVSRKPTVSLRKVESNRRNSQKSTGPKTATGKKIVSRNAVRHGFFSKARANLMTSMLALTNTISRSAGSKNFGWKRPPCGLGGFAGSYVVRAVKLPELLPGIATSSSNQGQTIWQNRSLRRRATRKWTP